MRQDVIILGGGIIGATLGYFLARAGMKPLILEPGEIGGGTTSASFAWANASTKTSDEAYHRMNAAGMAVYRELSAEMGAETLGINSAGALQVARRSDGPGYRELLADASKLNELGYRATLLDHATLQEYEPGLSFPGDLEALYLPDDMIIDAPHFTRQMVRRMRALGGGILKTAATALIADENGVVSGVETREGPQLADTVICAAGKDTGQLLADLTGYAPFASRFPMRQVPGFLLTTPPVAPDTLRHLIYTSTSDELHVLPAANGGIKMGSDDVDTLIWEDRSPAAMHKAAIALLKRAERFFPESITKVDPASCHLQVGVRAYPEDGKSLIGPLPGASGFYIVATHSGISLAPIIAKLMTEWVTGDVQPAELAPYTLTRFPGFTSG